MRTHEVDDSRKRTLLKILACTGATAGIAAVAPAFSHVMKDFGNAYTTDQKDTGANRRGELELSLISTSDIAEDTLLIRNTSNEQITINGFVGGAIVFRDRAFDSSRLCADEPLFIDADSSVSLCVDITDANALAPTDYIWAEETTETFDTGTHVVSLGAFMADDKAVLFADTRARGLHA